MANKGSAAPKLEDETKKTDTDPKTGDAFVSLPRTGIGTGIEGICEKCGKWGRECKCYAPPDGETPAETGAVDYDRFKGATCPKCYRIRATTYKTMPREKETDPIERYHGCQNCGHRFKSIEAV